MSWFSTKAFSFELPGAWQEHTIQLHRPADDTETAFAIARNPREGKQEVDLDLVVSNLPKGSNLEREILHNERVAVGPFDGQDMSLITRTPASAEYYRIVCVSYFDLELSFQWAGPAARRAEVDARADQLLQTVKFRQR